MLYLKQSTSVTVKIGPFLDDTDGKTAETGLTISQSDVRLSKNGGDIAQKNDSTGCTHDELGIYNCPLNATDTNTLGRLQLWVHKSGALPVWHEYMVIPANVYDSLFSTDKLQVDVTQIGGDAQSATDLKDFADTGYDPSTHKVQGVVLCDTTTTNTDMVPDVSSDVAAIKAKTDNLNFNADATPLVLADVRDVNDAAVTSVNDFKADVSNLDVAVSSRSNHSAADVWSVATRSLTDKAGFSLSSTGVDAIIDEVIEGSMTLREALRIILAASAGKSSGGGTSTVKYRDLADSKDRISATVDANGNRTAVTLDGS